MKGKMNKYLLFLTLEKNSILPILVLLTFLKKTASVII
jgi:hypothetical protein